jgi:hypothetical protein
VFAPLCNDEWQEVKRKRSNRQKYQKHNPPVHVVISPAGEATIMADEITVNKEKFDTLLRQMLKTTPLPKSEVKVAKPKPKKKLKK